MHAILPALVKQPFQLVDLQCKQIPVLLSTWPTGSSGGWHLSLQSKQPEQSRAMAIYPTRYACLIFRGRNHELAKPLGDDTMRSAILVQHAAPLDTEPGAPLKSNISRVLLGRARLISWQR